MRKPFIGERGSCFREGRGEKRIFARSCASRSEPARWPKAKSKKQLLAFVSRHGIGSGIGFLKDVE